MKGLSDRIMTGLAEALDHAKGREVANIVVHVPKQVDVSAIRARSGLSQPAFAARIGVRVPTLRNWEQHRRSPDGPARVLLAMLDHNPRVVEETLGRRSERLGTGQAPKSKSIKALQDAEKI